MIGSPNASSKRIGPRTLAAALFVCFLSAAVMRWEQPSRLQLCHFDEGVHASSVDSILTDGPWALSFAQAYESPPLLAWLAAGVGKIQGAFVPQSTVWISVVAGTLSIIVVFLIGQRIGGTPMGLVAAAALACSDLHVAVSRTGLPIVLSSLWFGLAVWSAGELAPKPLANGSVPRLKHVALCGVLLGLFGGLALLSSYSAVALIVVLGLAFFHASLRRTLELEDRRAYVFAGGLVGLAIGLAVCVIWLRHLEQEYGGSGEVIQVLTSQANQLASWHWNLARNLAALPALRHYGWVASVLLIGVVLLTLAGRSAQSSRANWRRWLAVLGALLAVGIATVAGADVLILAAGAAGILPALFSRRWPLILCAMWLLVWLGFVPLWHPEVKQLAPAMLPAILLALNLVWPDSLEPSTSRSGSPQFVVDTDDSHIEKPVLALRALPWLAGSLLVAGWVALLSPFGVTPTQQIWNRWYCGSGYAEFAERVAVETPESAAVICQGQSPLGAYCPREMSAMFHDVAFTRGLDGLASDQPVFLALDFRHIHSAKTSGGEANNTAREAVLKWLHCLQPIAVTPFEPSVLMLLDHLPPSLVYQKIHTRSIPSVWTDRNGRETPVPPDIRTTGENAIVLYQVDVAAIRAR